MTWTGTYRVRKAWARLRATMHRTRLLASGEYIKTSRRKHD